MHFSVDMNNRKSKQAKSMYDHQILSGDETKLVAWNDDDEPALILDADSGEILATIVGKYDSYAWFDNDTKIMAHDNRITVILDAITGEIIRFVEAYR